MFAAMPKRHELTDGQWALISDLFPAQGPGWPIVRASTGTTLRGTKRRPVELVLMGVTSNQCGIIRAIR